MTKHTHEELDECQAAYLGWAKANHAKASARCVHRNKWLRRHGRARHVIGAARIRNL